jgi:release factor glutamine methyltransferase
MALAGIAVADALDSAVIALRAAGCETPRLDAELLLAEAIGSDRAALHAHPERELPGEAIRPFQAMVIRRRDREPVAYILGRKGFRGVELEVDRRVLIPRPETELLVEVALGLPRGVRVLDVGTGSGAVALALKHERPDLHVTGSDASPDALDVAAANGRRLGLEVEWAVADLLGEADREWDAIVANLPYVRERDRPALAPEILRHEPCEALFAGNDGLDAIRRLVPLAAARTGWLALEIGEGQAEAVEGLMREAGLASVERRRDLAGVERVLVGSR